MAHHRTFRRMDFIRTLAGAAIALPAAGWIGAPSTAQARTVSPWIKTAANQLFVQRIDFEHQLQDGIVQLQSSVHIVTPRGVASGAQVSVRITMADGSNVHQTRKTDASGIARFTTAGTGAGTYTLTVTDVSKVRHTYRSSANIVTSTSLEVHLEEPPPSTPPTNQPTDRVSVHDFGARGDGITDDSVALQNAVNAMASSGGGVVYFPSGTYSINSTLWLGTGVRLVGEHRDSVILAPTTDMTILEVISASDVTVSNITIKGTYPRGSWGYGVLAYDAGQLTIESCLFVDLPDTALHLIRVHEVSVMDCEFRSIRASGVRLAPAGEGYANRNIHIRNNAFLQVNHAALGGHSAVHCHGEPGALNEYIWIENNHVESGGIGLGLDDIDHGVITGNRIIGNTVEGEGIAFTGSNNTISDNVVSNAFAAGILNWAVAYRSNTDNVITGNTCWDNSQGIAIVCGEKDAAVHNLSVRHNRCYAEKHDSRQQFGIQHYIDGTTEFKWTNVRIADNDLRGNTVWAYHIVPPADATFDNNLV
jgi:hypothetical protein